MGVAVLLVYSVPEFMSPQTSTNATVIPNIAVMGRSWDADGIGICLSVYSVRRTT